MSDENEKPPSEPSNAEQSQSQQPELARIVVALKRIEQQIRDVQEIAAPGRVLTGQISAPQMMATMIASNLALLMAVYDALWEIAEFKKQWNAALQ